MTIRAMRAYDEEIVQLSDPCPFCPDGKITSGTWIETNGTGTPCCLKCFHNQEEAQDGKA